jgi:hypothetical protein
VSRAGCTLPLTADALLAYWLGETDSAEQARIDEHLLGCARCSEELAQILAIGTAVREVARGGGLHVVLTEASVRRMLERGMRVREYRVPHNGAVSCTVTPDDDIVVSRLAAPLQDVKRLDLVQRFEGHADTRLEDVPFDAATGGVVLASHMGALRALRASSNRMQLIAVDGAGRDRVIGEYTFNHTPFGEQR